MRPDGEQWFPQSAGACQRSPAGQNQDHVRLCGNPTGILQIGRLVLYCYGSKCYIFGGDRNRSQHAPGVASKPFMRFARRFGVEDEALWETVNGAYDADLGGGVFKYRLAREGEGSSGGARALIAMKTGQRAVLMFGFEKKDLANIKPDELRGYRKAARIYLGYNEEEIIAIVKEKAFFEIAPSRKGVEHGKNIQEQSIRGVTRKHV